MSPFCHHYLHNMQDDPDLFDYTADTTSILGGRSITIHIWQRSSVPVSMKVYMCYYHDKQMCA